MERVGGGGHSLQMLTSLCYLMLHVVYTPFFSLPVCHGVWLVNNIPALVRMMTWRREGDKSLSEPMIVCLLMHECITLPQWVKSNTVDQEVQHHIIIKPQWVNSSPPPSAAYMRLGIGSALVQIMACRLFGAKPLSKPMLGYCQLDP